MHLEFHFKVSRCNIYSSLFTIQVAKKINKHSDQYSTLDYKHPVDSSSAVQWVVCAHF